MRIEPYSGLPEEWDSFGQRQQGWTAYHRHAWKPLIEAVHRHECPYLAAYGADDRLAGILPLVRVRSRVFGHFLVSMPFVNYGGPLGSDSAVLALARAATDLATDRGARLLELRSRVQLPLSLPVSSRKITVVLDLPPDVDALRKHVGSKLRSQVKRPEKEGVVVRFGPDQVDPFFRVFSKHMHHLGTPTQPRALFRGLADRLGDDAWFGCAWLGDEPIAAGAGFRWGDEFEMSWASALQPYNAIAPNMLLYWRFMERAIDQGVRRFNFGRCTPGSGTHRFKRQWGSRDEALWWYQHGAATATPSPTDARYAWGPRLWRRLPERVATWAGPLLVRGIP